MSTYNANVVVHIDESLSTNQLQDMELDISCISGVICTCIHEKTPHLLVVDYDPRTVRSSHLLQHIQGNGLHAELIGGL